LRLDAPTPIKGLPRGQSETLIPAGRGPAVMSEEDEELDEDGDDEDEGWGDEEETEE
jgi:hypothetical protein